MNSGQVNLEQLVSASALLVQMQFGETDLALGTGFLMLGPAGLVLITARHNVTGRNLHTGEPISTKTAAIPNRIAIRHNVGSGVGAWDWRVENLTDADERPRWFEHPTLRERGDFIALPLTSTEGIHPIVHVVDDSERNDIRNGPTSVVSILGFPFGVSSGDGYAVWATGFVATRPEDPYDNMPIFLVDCRSREGQSGSPVILFRPAGSSITMSNGADAARPKDTVKLLGVYSGRINKDSDLGIVWKTSAISELLASIPDETTP